VSLMGTICAVEMGLAMAGVSLKGSGVVAAMAELQKQAATTRAPTRN